MAEKKTNIFENPFILSAGISAVLSAIVSPFSLDAAVMTIINVLIPPLSLMLSYALAWLSARFYTLTIQEQYVLSRLNAREKRIRQDMKNGDISQAMRQKLSKELDQITWEKSQIGKAVVSASDN